MGKLSIKDKNTGNKLSIETKDLDRDIYLTHKDFNRVRDNIKDLLTITDVVKDDVVIVKGYHKVGDAGYGIFRWDPDIPKHKHDGGLYIDPNKSFPSDWNNLDEVNLWFTPDYNSTETGCWVRIFSGRVDVKWYGAIGDQVVDDTMSIQQAINSNYPLLFSVGSYLITKTLYVRRYPINWEGVGRAYSNDTTGYYNNRSILYFKTNDPYAIVFDLAYNPTTHYLDMWENEGSQIRDLVICADSHNPPNQHGIVLRKLGGMYMFHNLGIYKFTGYGIAVDPNAGVQIPVYDNRADADLIDFQFYAQSVSLRDVHFDRCGGAIGMTVDVDEFKKKKYLSITGMVLDNIACENGINPVSPQNYLFDFRSMREIEITGLITEGDGDVKRALMGVGTDAWVDINGWHVEYTGGGPAYTLEVWSSLAKVPPETDGDKVGYFFGNSAAWIHIKHLTSYGKIKLAPYAPVTIKIYHWESNNYNVKSIGDLIEIPDMAPYPYNAQPQVIIEDLTASSIRKVEPKYSSFVTIKSIKDTTRGIVHHYGPKKLFEWYPNKGSLLNLKNRFINGGIYGPNTTSGIVADAVDSKLLVEEFTNSGNKFPSFALTLELPDDWIGASVAMVMRYYVEASEDDLTQFPFQILRGSSINTLTSLIDTNIYNQWTTGVVIFKPTANSINVWTNDIYNKDYTNPVKFRVAALACYLGTYYEEPMMYARA